MTRWGNDWRVSWSTTDSDDPDRDRVVAESIRFRADLEAFAERAAELYPDLRIVSLDGIEQPETEDAEPETLARYAQLDPGRMPWP